MWSAPSSGWLRILGHCTHLLRRWGHISRGHFLLAESRDSLVTGASTVYTDPICARVPQLFCRVFTSVSPKHQLSMPSWELRPRDGLVTSTRGVTGFSRTP